MRVDTLINSFGWTPTKIGSVIIAFLLSALVTYTLASVFQSLFVLQALEAAGAQFSLSVWFYVLVHDLYGLAFGGKYVSYGQIILIGLFIALVVAALCLRWIPLPRVLIYSMAGATAMATILYLVELNFYGLTLFAGVRGKLGVSAQLVAGALGGLTFSTVISLKYLSQRGRAQ